MSILSHFIKYGDFKYIGRQRFVFLLSINRKIVLLLRIKSIIHSVSN